MKSKFVLKEVETSETALDYTGNQLSIGDIVVFAEKTYSDIPYLTRGKITKITLCKDPEDLKIKDTRITIEKLDSSIGVGKYSIITEYSYAKRKYNTILKFGEYEES